MAEPKQSVEMVTVGEVLDEEAKSKEHNTKKSTSHGFQKAVFERYINPQAIINFGFTLQASWEGAALAFQFSLLNGGPASLVYGSIFVGTGSTLIATSLAEMASMDPVVGAQYRWSAAFAPAYPEFWGLFQGWMTVFAWITCTAASPAYLAYIVQGLVIFNYDSYVPQRWHATLMMFAFAIIPAICNFWTRRILNKLEMIGGICHVAFFLISVITLGVMARRSTSEFVFKTLTNDISGWTNPCVAWSLGLLTVAFPTTGVDGMLHMSDEVKEPKKRIPLGMVVAVAMNSTLQFAYMVCIMYFIGDINTVTNSPTGLPIIEVYYEATKSKHYTNFLIMLMFIVLFISLFNILASVSRLAWSFSRDKGLPFCNFFSYVHPKYKIPTNSLALVAIICCLLALINIGSSTAFNALLSLPLIATYISYFIPILFLLLRKLKGQHPRYGPFKLGRWGIPINTASLLYILYVLSFIPLPSIRPTTAANMNWAGPVALGVILIALLDWTFNGHKRFTVPDSKALEEDY